MKKLAWIFSAVLTMAFAYQLSVGGVNKHAVKQTDAKQYTTKQEVSGSGVVKGDFQLPLASTSERTSTFTSYAIVLSNRLVDVYFTHQAQSFTKLKSILFSPTFLRLRVLRL